MHKEVKVNKKQVKTLKGGWTTLVLLKWKSGRVKQKWEMINSN